MSHAVRKRDAPSLVLRVSVPAGRGFEGVAADLAVKVAEYVGESPADAKEAGALIESLARQVGAHHDHGTGHADVTFEFHEVDGELRIEARCADRSSVARRPLPT
jgi:hypothetical protein